MSIKNYTEATARVAATFADVEVRAASWWAPRPVGSLLDRKRRQPPLNLDDAAEFDIVHVADMGLGHVVPGVRGARTVVTCHDVMPFIVPGFYGSRRDRLFAKALLREPVRGMLRANRLITVSQCSANDISKALGVDPERITVVGVPISHEYGPRSEPETQLASEGICLAPGPKIMSIGDSARYKNLELLIRALALPELAGVQLIRVGGRLTAEQVAVAREVGVLERIRHLGTITREAVINLYSLCDVVAQPSLYEGFGMPVAEAMACGAPVVCSDGGSLPEVAGGAARVVQIDRDSPGTNAEVIRAFGGGLAKVIENRAERDRLIALGMERAEYFRPEALCGRLAEAYSKVLTCEAGAGTGSRAIRR